MTPNAESRLAEFEKWADRLAQALASVTYRLDPPTGPENLYDLLIEYREWRNR